MAIESDVVQYNGTERKKQYLRIFEMRLDKKRIYVDLGYNFDKDDEVPYETVTHEIPYDINGVNPYQQAYVWLQENVYPDGISAN